MPTVKSQEAHHLEVATVSPKYVAARGRVNTTSEKHILVEYESINLIEGTVQDMSSDMLVMEQKEVLKTCLVTSLRESGGFIIILLVGSRLCQQTVQSRKLRLPLVGVRSRKCEEKRLQAQEEFWSNCV